MTRGIAPMEDSMNISFDERSSAFRIDTLHTTYIIGLADGVRPGHVYYGKKLPDETDRTLDIAEALRLHDVWRTPAERPGEKVNFLDGFPAEYPCGGIGDFRESAVELTDAAGFTACEFLYASHEIRRDKPTLPGLPQTFGDDYDEHQALFAPDDDSPAAQKTFRNGMIVILRNASIYTTLGQRLY